MPTATAANPPITPPAMAATWMLGPGGGSGVGVTEGEEICVAKEAEDVAAPALVRLGCVREDVVADGVLLVLVLVLIIELRFDVSNVVRLGLLVDDGAPTTL